MAKFGTPPPRAAASAGRPAGQSSEAGSAAEASLVARLKSGEPAAFEELLRDHGPRMLALARRYLPRESDAEDALQDALLSAYRGIASFEGASQLGTWLHRVTVNAALMRIRSRSRRPEATLDEARFERWEAPAGGFLSEGTTPDLLARAEMREAVRRAVERLEEDSRIVLRLRDIERVDLREISSLLGIGLSTVKSRLRRGRLALREILAPYYRASDR